jgi:hypothetical protein
MCKTLDYAPTVFIISPDCSRLLPTVYDCFKNSFQQSVNQLSPTPHPDTTGGGKTVGLKAKRLLPSPNRLPTVADRSQPFEYFLDPHGPLRDPQDGCAGFGF